MDKNKRMLWISVKKRQNFYTEMYKKLAIRKQISCESSELIMTSDYED